MKDYKIYMPMGLEYQLKNAQMHLENTLGLLAAAKRANFDGDPGPRKVIEGVELFLEMCDKDLTLLIRLLEKKRVKS